MLCAAAPSSLLAQVLSGDMEALPPDLPGWSAQITAPSNENDYRSASKWDGPMTIRPDTDRPHSGVHSIKWTFTAAAPGMASFRPALIPVTEMAREVVVQFFARAQGFPGPVIFAVDEMKLEKERFKSHWKAAMISPADDWVKVEWKATLDPATTHLRLAFAFKDSPAGASLWIDDVTVTAAVADYR